MNLFSPEVLPRETPEIPTTPPDLEFSQAIITEIQVEDSPRYPKLKHMTITFHCSGDLAMVDKLLDYFKSKHPQHYGSAVYDNAFGYSTLHLRAEPRREVYT